MKSVHLAVSSSKAILGAALVSVVIGAGLAGLAYANAPSEGDKLVPYFAVLNAGQETMQPDSRGQGVAFLFHNVTTGELSFSITYGDLEGTESAAHFHGPAAPGEDAGVQVGLPDGNPKVGCVALSKEQLKMLKKGLLYINIHSDMFLAGEIRGQVLPLKGVKYKFGAN